ncbi:MAG TPA: SDR family oxidoreductase [Thermoleophilia bacterium]|nr:SDR family oxidoreductase [Thermoleophilia bacterium]HQG04137.1 SDR family oxidoreductase [Thermoleophilia bacterium]HQG54898.1 SDR family oxidoreductase [Thermoleophilia bacterium]HQJ98450.1 SDR family oxidoreductase [Thermoleophilia bacterium]
MDLEHKTAFVTGGGDGVWPAIARRLAADGAGLVVCTPDEKQARQLETELEAAGAAAYCIGADPARPRDVESALGELLRVFGHLDVAVADLTTRPPGCVLDIDDATFAATLAADLRAAFGVAQRAARLMVARGRGGSIVLVADSLTDAGGVRSLAGDACGGALERMTRAMAHELGPHGVRVNLVRCQTGPAHEPLPPFPLGRPARAEEVAAAVAYLAGGGASYVSGATLVVDCGLEAVR